MSTAPFMIIAIHILKRRFELRAKDMAPHKDDRLFLATSPPFQLANSNQFEAFRVEKVMDPRPKCFKNLEKP